MTLKEHYAAGHIHELFKAGIISINHMTYFRYNQVFEAYLSQGKSRNESFLFTADECGTCEMTIRRAVRIINQ